MLDEVDGEFGVLVVVGNQAGQIAFLVKGVDGQQCVAG
jgi:hypothetical protein